MKKKKELPSVEKMSKLGFQDGYCGYNSQSDTYLSIFIKRGIIYEEIRSRILAYELGYKKGIYIDTHDLKKIKTINGEITINGKPFELNETEIINCENKINELAMEKTLKKRRYNETI